MLGNPRSQNMGLSKPQLAMGVGQANVLSGVGGNTWNQDLASVRASCLHSLFSALLLTIAWFKIMLLKHRSLRECQEKIFFSQFCSIIHQICASHLCLYNLLWKEFPGLFLFQFSFLGFVLFMWSKSAGEAGLKQSEGHVGGLQEISRDRRKESSGFAPALLPHTSALLSPAEVPSLCHTPGLHSQNCPIMQSHLPYQVIWYSVSLHLISSRPALGAIVAVWQISMKKEKDKTL